MPNQERTFSAAGRTYILRFTHGALYRLERTLGRPLADLDGDPEADELRAMLWAGLEGARLKSGFQSEPVSHEQAGELVNALGQPTAASIVLDALRAALPKKTPRPERGSEATAAPIPRDWERLLADAMELGLKPDEFWNMTPKELALYAAAQARRVQNEIRRNLATAWNIAALVRAATLPPLSQILDQNEVAELSEEELAERRSEFEQLTAAMLPNGRSNG